MAFSEWLADMCRDWDGLSRSLTPATDDRPDRQQRLVQGLPFSATRGPVARRIAEARSADN
jgi:hypothetical protein